MAEPFFTDQQHTEYFIIRTFEIDHEQCATIPSLIRLMHEAAMQHVIRLKLSVWDLEKQGISWVLLRQRLDIDRMPRLGERISVITYPSGFDRFFTYRDFRVFDSAQREIARASSTWVLMDMATRKVRRLPDFILALEHHVPVSELCLPHPEKRIHSLNNPDRSLDYQVQYFDLDFNQHLNNTLYLKWMLESLPDEVFMERRCREVHLEYRAECRWKERVQAETEIGEDDQYYHRLLRIEDGKELALASTVWK